MFREVIFNDSVQCIRRFTFICARFEVDWNGRPSLYQPVNEALAQLVSGTVEENPQVLHLPSEAAFEYLELLSLVLWTLSMLFLPFYRGHS